MSPRFKQAGKLILALSMIVGMAGCQSFQGFAGAESPPEVMGTGDLGLVIERASGSVLVINTSRSWASRRVG